MVRKQSVQQRLGMNLIFHLFFVIFFSFCIFVSFIGLISLRNKGWTLSETADVMINDFGVEFGMNMDGGGSSVFVVQNGKVKSKPTCLDVPIICERPVTTVMCLTHESSWNPTRIKLRP